MPFGCDDLRYTIRASESKAINARQEPAIIISSSGRCEAGRVLHHLRDNIDNPKNTVLIVGYVTTRRPSWPDLYEAAAAQAGHFTAEQAAKVGFSLPLLAHHLKAGRLLRARRGVYRLVQSPPCEHEELVAVLGGVTPVVPVLLSRKMENETATFLGPRSDWQQAVVELPSCGGGPNRPTPWVCFVGDGIRHKLPPGPSVRIIALARDQFSEVLDLCVAKNILVVETIGVPLRDEPVFRIRLVNKAKDKAEGRKRFHQENPDFQAVWDHCWALLQRYPRPGQRRSVRAWVSAVMSAWQRKAR